MSDTEPTNAPGWNRVAHDDGILTFRLASWSDFFDFLETEVFHSSLSPKHNYIWRGQCRSDWTLSPSLDRLFRKLSLETLGCAERESQSTRHL